MKLLDQISDSIKDAMKSKDAGRLSALRLIKTELNKAGPDSGKELSEDDELKVLRRMMKQRKESLEQFRAGNRLDLAAKEEEEMRIIEGFLPSALSEDEILQTIDTVLAEIGPLPSGTTTGMIIGKIMSKLRATGKSFDGKQVNELVLKKLQP